MQAQQDAEARAKDALRAPVRDALQRRLCKALDSRDLPRLLRDLQALPKGVWVWVWVWVHEQERQ